MRVARRYSGEVSVETAERVVGGLQSYINRGAQRLAGLGKQTDPETLRATLAAMREERSGLQSAITRAVATGKKDARLGVLGIWENASRTLLGAPLGARSAPLSMIGAYANIGGGGNWRTLLHRDTGKYVKAVDGIFYDGMIAGRGPEELARRLRRYVQGSERFESAFDFYTDQIDLRKLTLDERKLARTMVSNARRIAFSEVHNARAEAEIMHFSADPLISAVRWTLSPDRGTADVPDECDLLASTDYYGMGPGVYPLGKVPVPPHPYDRCERAPVTRSQKKAAGGAPKPNPPKLRRPRFDPSVTKRFRSKDAFKSAAERAQQSGEFGAALTRRVNRLTAPEAVEDRIPWDEIDGKEGTLSNTELARIAAKAGTDVGTLTTLILRRRARTAPKGKPKGTFVDPLDDSRELGSPRDYALALDLDEPLDWRGPDGNLTKKGAEQLAGAIGAKFDEFDELLERAKKEAADGLAGGIQAAEEIIEDVLGRTGIDYDKGRILITEPDAVRAALRRRGLDKEDIDRIMRAKVELDGLRNELYFRQAAIRINGLPPNAARGEITRRVRHLLSPDENSVGLLNWKPSPQGASVTDRVRNGIAVFERLMHPSALPRRTGVTIEPKSAKVRAHYDPTRGQPDTGATVVANVADGPETWAHELGHWVEDRANHAGDFSPANRSALRFRASREEGTDLIDIGEARYGKKNGELAVRDRFYTEYVGRVYGGSGGRFTEIVSTGLESMAENPVRFMQQDLEHWLFTLRLMHGQEPWPEGFP